VDIRNSIIITEVDERRISGLLELKGHELDPRTADLLEEELSGAKVVNPSELPPGVVTMNSVVLFEDLESGQRAEITLVYPGDAAAAEGRVSILAPIGGALIGLSVGDSIRWPMPAGRSRHLRVVDVRYQPEANGRFDT
jgi:regulator of nucleoside diphosphate kinase